MLTMNFSDLISPLLRKQWPYVFSVVLVTLLSYSLIDYMVPDTQKTTLYFSVKPASTVSGSGSSLTLDPLESSMKVAEMISGWAKDPSFRKMILIKSKANVSKFKKKIAAKKQNRANVFWTLKLPKKEQKEQAKLIEGVKESILARLETFNEDNQYPFAITPIEESIDYSVIPVSWRVSACFIFALILGYLVILMGELSRGTISFLHQVRQTFPQAPILYFSGKKNETGLWKHFMDKISVKELVSTFDDKDPDKKLFLADIKHSSSGDTTLVYVKLGSTTIRHLENLAAVYKDEKIGVIVLA